MKRHLPLLGMAVLGAGIGSSAISSGGASQDDVAAAGAMFKQRCASCHVPPDLRFGADRAWLSQVMETS